jgi:uncharacterized membrane protein YfcA
MGFFAVFIATFANLIGAGGSKFFSPIYIYHIHLRPIDGIIAALLTQTFGFASGSLAYFLSKEIDFERSKYYLTFSLPLVIVGSILSHQIETTWIEIAFGLTLCFSSVMIFYSDQFLKYFDAKSDQNGKSEKVLISLGGFFLGFLSVGLGELITPILLLKYKLSSSKSVGTAVFVVFCSTVVSVFTHLSVMTLQSNPFFSNQIVTLLIWTIPGAIIGAQIGSRINGFISVILLKKILTIAFFFLGISILFIKSLEHANI